MEIALKDVIRSLRRMGDMRSRDTEDHAVRVRDIAVQIGQELHLSDHDLTLLGYAADVHDFGKLYVFDAILYKAGPLNQAEYSHIQGHCQWGYDALELFGLPREILETVLYHQERWDGSGYPKGLRGEDIPLFARIVGIADVWDALQANRPYRQAQNAIKTIEIMCKSADGFDPHLFRIFLALVRGDKV